MYRIPCRSIACRGGGGPRALVLYHRRVTDQAHDPGEDSAGERGSRVLDAAAQPIVVPSGGVVRIGTASWTDPTMLRQGVFYPRGADTPEERLAYYASQFPLVEIDATYYALPVPNVARAWVERTPPDCVFDAKAHALMTGQPTETRRLPKIIRDELPAELVERPRIYAKDLPEELRAAIWDLFRAGLEPLRESGQMGSVLLQYPRWFFPSHENRDEILETRERLGDWPSAVEFRAGSWLNEKNRDRTLAFLAGHRIPLVLVDEPQGLKSSVPAVDAVTSPDLVIVRFHGRRAETWEAKGVPTIERFRYLYDRDELSEWVPRIHRAAMESGETHVLMNNCFGNYAPTNARELAALLVRDLEDEAEPRDGAFPSV